MPTLFPDETKSIIDALLFVSDEPLALKTMAEIIDCPQYDLKILLNEIKADCERKKRVLFTRSGWGIFTTRPEYAPYIENWLNHV